MHKIDLRIHPDEMFALLELIHLPSHYSTQQALNNLNLDELLLIEWRGRITPQQVLTWQQRNTHKTYTVKLPISLAVALRSVLQRVHLNYSLQGVSDALDGSLVNNGLSTKTLTYSGYG